MKILDSNKLLRSRDVDFDISRSFLIASMVIAHVFISFYQMDYNRNLTVFVTMGFVFLSGFTIGALYLQRIRENPQKYFSKLAVRAFKLFLVFVVANASIFIMYSNKLNALFQLEAHEIIGVFTLGIHQNLFGFDILIPIGWTSFLSWFLLRFYSRRVGIIFILFLLFSSCRKT